MKLQFLLIINQSYSNEEGERPTERCEFAVGVWVFVVEGEDLAVVIETLACLLLLALTHFDLHGNLLTTRQHASYSGENIMLLHTGDQFSCMFNNISNTSPLQSSSTVQIIMFKIP